MEHAKIESVTAARRAISEDARKVRDVLVERGLETPLLENGLNRDQKYERIRESFAEIARTLGLDLSDDSLCDTPQRIARMYVDEIFSGLDYGRFPKATAIENKMGVEEMVRIDDISVVSTCEHHFVTIDGVASVAYIPGGKIIGLSKVNRIVRFFAQRPQVQERLT
ncbi:MAG: GTP cyclohydrolase I FolE, partial [Halioglobus sp.]|nr:GTP cyclohydrolase I FolE [Halioglobus sp.]